MLIKLFSFSNHVPYNLLINDLLKNQTIISVVIRGLANVSANPDGMARHVLDPVPLTRSVKDTKRTAPAKTMLIATQ